MKPSQEEINWLFAKRDKAQRDLKMWDKKIREAHKRYADAKQNN